MKVRICLPVERAEAKILRDYESIVGMMLNDLVFGECREEEEFAVRCCAICTIGLRRT